MSNDNGLELRALEMQAHLRVQLQAVAQRIVEAARVAAAMHLEATPGLGSEHYGQDEHYGQRVAIGGAGADTPGVSEDSRLPKGPSRGEVVTEDESPAPPPPASDYAHTRRPGRYSPAD